MLILYGKAKLTDTVPSFAAHRTAELDACGAPGVTSVENELTVEDPKQIPICTDNEMRSRIDSMLL